MGTVSALLVTPSAKAAGNTNTFDAMRLGSGEWISGPSVEPRERIQSLSPTFITYSTRFLIHYDETVKLWWDDLEASLSLLPPEKREQRLGKSFGTLAKSLQTAYESGSSSPLSLFQEFVSKYGKLDNDAERQIMLLFALLPASKQPVSGMDRWYDKQSFGLTGESPPASIANPMQTTLFGESLTALLPQQFHLVKRQNAYSIEPFLAFYEIGIGEGNSATEYATLFGPLAATPLARDSPLYRPSTYALLGLAGATGCCLTHTVVIPLDVVKTRAQTEANTDNLVAAASRIVESEGPAGLFLGAQATILGYLWYGVSVYPCYTFFKRIIGMTLLPIDWSIAHTNEVALTAGALASVVASLGLTPLEAARIRVVADPGYYRPLGVSGTIQAIASSGESALGSLYAGLPSLLTRQVIFGSVKFLAFERACEAIFAVAPVLRDASWTSLAVSLAAGGFSGVLSSVVSQPADSLLTYVAKDDRDMGLWEGARAMIVEDGPTSLFRGLGSRCVWAGSIIAGQFFLYDIFRTYFGVSSEDLTQLLEIHLNGQG